MLGDVGAVHLIEQREAIGIGAARSVGELVRGKKVGDRLLAVGSLLQILAACQK